VCIFLIVVNWNAVGAIATMIAAAGGLVYVGLTFKLWQVAERSYKAAHRPILGLSNLPLLHEPSTGENPPAELILIFEMENFGTVIADGILVHFEINISGKNRAKYSTDPLLLTPLAPRHKFNITHPVSPEGIVLMWTKGNESLLTIKISYKGLENTQFESLDLWAFDRRVDEGLHRVQVTVPSGMFQKKQ
jgi:hypothetical protein